MPNDVYADCCSRLMLTCADILRQKRKNQKTKNSSTKRLQLLIIKLVLTYVTKLQIALLPFDYICRKLERFDKYLSFINVVLNKVMQGTLKHDI